MEEQNQKVGRTAQEIERNDQKKEKKEKTDELRKLISDVVDLALRYVVRSASLAALAYDRDRNHLVGTGCQIYLAGTLAKSLKCFVHTHRLIHNVACRSNVECVSC